MYPSQKVFQNTFKCVCYSMATLVAQMVKNPCRRLWFYHWVGKIPWRRAWQPTPAFLPGESHGQRSLVGYSLLGHKESDMTEWLSTATLEEWNISWHDLSILNFSQSLCPCSLHSSHKWTHNLLCFCTFVCTILSAENALSFYQPELKNISSVKLSLYCLFLYFHWNLHMPNFEQ